MEKAMELRSGGCTGVTVTDDKSGEVYDESRIVRVARVVVGSREPCPAVFNRGVGRASPVAPT